MTAQAISFLGTGSEVGKSIITAGFCRIFSDLNYSVAPFKSQNMSNNSGVTIDGLEMGRAQIVQAHAARVEPHVDMNPILLKPNSDTGSQVVLHGKAESNKGAGGYFKSSTYYRDKAFASLHRLQEQYELICIEGAGSCAEMNLKPVDFVNFPTAQEANAPVILIADIDRGGVFAQIIGTYMLLPQDEAALIKGVIINRFRGDISLFQEGVTYIENKINIPVLGVVPYLPNLDIDPEDAVYLDRKMNTTMEIPDNTLALAVIRLPHIANSSDFLVLEQDPAVTIHFLSTLRKLDEYDALIIPGSKNVRGDLDWLRQNGWHKEIERFTGKIIGICGGYQMLGKEIRDPQGFESCPGVSPGLGYLDCSTTLNKNKQLRQVAGFSSFFNTPLYGYEIHQGITEIGTDNYFAKLNIDQQTVGDGCWEKQNRIFGTYIHGLFDHPALKKAFLQWCNPTKVATNSQLPDIIPDKISDSGNKDVYSHLAQHLKKHISIEKVVNLLLSK